MDTIETYPSVVMFTAPNPGPRTLEGTHTFVVGGADGYVIDPGPDLPGYIEQLAAWCRQAGGRPRGIFLTHSHPDHAPGAARLKEQLGVPVWASEAFPSEAAENAGVDRRFVVGDEFPIDGDVIQVIPSPGHAFDHVAFWLPGARILFAGDTILGRGSSLVAPPEGDMLDYMETLERFRSLRPRLIAPGHGPVVTDPLSKIDEYIKHRRLREAQVLSVLSAGPATIEDLVRKAYTDVDPRLHGLARGSVEAQLQKLKREGRVDVRDELWALR